MASRKGLGLCEAIGDQDVVAVVIDCFGWRCGNKKVTRDECCALMQHLVEGVLSIGSRFAPDDHGGTFGGWRAIDSGAFAVALHFELLEVGRQAMQMLVIGQYSARLAVPAFAVPAVQESQEYWNVLVHGRIAEVAVHFMRALKECGELVESDRHGNRESNRRPHGIPPANPVPELEHIVSVDSERGHSISVG